VLLSIFGHFQIDCSVMMREQIFQYNKNHMIDLHASCVIALGPFAPEYSLLDIVEDCADYRNSKAMFFRKSI
jgi:hypothetical protein